MELINCRYGNRRFGTAPGSCIDAPPLLIYFINLDINQITSAITAATSKRPVHTPALKIPPISSQELIENISKVRMMRLIRCITLF